MFLLLWLDYFGANSPDDYAVKNLGYRKQNQDSVTLPRLALSVSWGKF